MMMEASVTRGRYDHTFSLATSFRPGSVVCILLMTLSLARSVPLPSNQAVGSDLWSGPAYGSYHGQRVADRGTMRGDPVYNHHKESERNALSSEAAQMGLLEKLKDFAALLNALLQDSGSNAKLSGADLVHLAELLKPLVQEQMAGQQTGKIEKRGPRFSVSGDLQVTSDFLRGLQNRRQHYISASNVYNDLKDMGRK